MSANEIRLLKYKFRKSNVGEDVILKTDDIATLNTKIKDWINDVSITDVDIKDNAYQFRNAQLILYRPFMPCPKTKASNLEFSNSQFSNIL
ncbi:hypothetical protein E3Q00_04299 [Wallemia mellicola]|nr:hypothetical protein E3Q00_04299 [Wallemia mellicola]